MSEPIQPEAVQSEFVQSEPAKFVTVANVESLTEGYGRKVQVADKEIAVFRVGEEYFAIDNECPHYGADLCDGYLRNGKVSCPWHGWQFDLRSGECLTAPGCDLHAYEVRVENGAVQIALEE